MHKTIVHQNISKIRQTYIKIMSNVCQYVRHPTNRWDTGRFQSLMQLWSYVGGGSANIGGLLGGPFWPPSGSITKHKLYISWVLKCHKRPCMWSKYMGLSMSSRIWSLWILDSNFVMYGVWFGNLVLISWMTIPPEDHI